MSIQAFDFSVNLLRALLWQYNEASRLESLLTQKQEWFNVENQGFWDDWMVDVFDLRTANDFGLAVWAIILNMPLTVSQNPDEPDKPIWGFAVDEENFTNGNFATWIQLPLTTAQRRLILRLRYFQLVTTGAVPEINEFLRYLFEDEGRAYVTDGLNMTARYVFEFGLPNEVQQVLSTFDLLPRPAGVEIDYIILPEVLETWGFGVFRQNFNNGNFYHG